MPANSLETAFQKLSRLARSEFPDIDRRPAERNLIDHAVRGQTFSAGPGADEKDISNRPEYAEAGDPEKGVAPWDHNRDIRAGVIRWLCVNREAKVLVDPSGISVIGARIIDFLNLNSAEIPFTLALKHCFFTDAVGLYNCNTRTIDLTGSWMRSVYATLAHMKGSFTIVSSRIEGTLYLEGAQIEGDLVGVGAAILSDHPEPARRVALQAQDCDIGGNVNLRAMDSSTPLLLRGMVSFINGKIGGDLDLSGASLTNPGVDRVTFFALNLPRCVIKGSLFLRPEQGHSFNAEGLVDLRSTFAGLLSNAEWPANVNPMLDGLTYNNLDPKDAKLQLAWIQREQGYPQPTQPYRQLARVLQDSGDSDGAEMVLMAMERKLTDTELARAAKWFVGYGYRPLRMAAPMTGLILAGALVYWRANRMAQMVPTEEDAYTGFSHGKLPVHYPRFHPLVYSLENSFPLVKLGQSDKWQAEPAAVTKITGRLSRIRRWLPENFLRTWIWIQILLGWLFATWFLAGLSGVVKHG